MKDQLASRFLQEIPISLATEEDLRNMQPGELTRWSAQWFGKTPAPLSAVYTFGSKKVSKAPSVKPKAQKRTRIHSKGSTLAGAWRINQPVRHETFGLGMIKKTEKKGDRTFVTVAFKGSTKKVLSTFLQRV